MRVDLRNVPTNSLFMFTRENLIHTHTQIYKQTNTRAHRARVRKDPGEVSEECFVRHTYNTVLPSTYTDITIYTTTFTRTVWLEKCHREGEPQVRFTMIVFTFGIRG